MGGTQGRPHLRLEGPPSYHRGRRCAPDTLHPHHLQRGGNQDLIDGGAGLNVLSPEAFILLHIPPSWLRPSKPFSRVSGGSTSPLGQIRLPVTFGTRDNYRTELIDFEIARIDLP